jgi:hypothetical protein
MPGSDWTSLEVAQLAVSALTPIAVLGLGLLVSNGARRVEALQHANQTVVARRVEIFADVAKKLNRLLCFATFVGRWKEVTPADVLILKRDIDEVMYANRLIFSDELFSAYQAFMTCFFVMYATVEEDALIRAPISSVWGDRRSLEWWSPAMTAAFAADKSSQPDEIQFAHEKLTTAFRKDLYVTEMTRPLM